MAENKNDGIDALVKAYSVISDRESDWLSGAVMKMKQEGPSLNQERVRELLNRFSDNKPFGDLVLEAISAKKIAKEAIVQDLNISQDIFEKVLANMVLPNIIPLRKMISLLNFLNISISCAIESFKVSLNRFTSDQLLSSAPGIAMRRNQALVYHKDTAEDHGETLKRSMDIYIKRLLDEGR